MNAWQDDNEPQRGAPEWLVTYADFMTLLLAFFVMVVSVSDINLHDGRFDSLKSSLGRHFGADASAEASAMGSTTPRNAPLAKWIGRAQEERRHWLADGEGDAAAAAEPLTLQAALVFDGRDVALAPQHLAELTRRAANWKTAGERYEIVGYIESRDAAVSDEYARRLERAQLRASALQLWLVEQGGVPPENIRIAVIPASARREPAAAGRAAQLDLYTGGSAASPAVTSGTSRIGDLRFTNGGFAAPVR